RNNCCESPIRPQRQGVDKSSGLLIEENGPAKPSAAAKKTFALPSTLPSALPSALPSKSKSQLDPLVCENRVADTVDQVRQEVFQRVDTIIDSLCPSCSDDTESGFFGTLDWSACTI